MIVALLDHLWQSTLFAAMAGLAILLFRNNGAGIRYGLWFAASMKFLIPFALFTMIGRALAVPVKPDVGWSPLLCDLQPAVQPFSFVPPAVTPAQASGAYFVPLLIGLWALGFVAVLAVWLLRWSSLRNALRMAWDANIAADLAVKYSPASLAPGLVGIVRPVLVLPEGISARLSPEELQSVIMHERCHLRRRDNLTAGLHMIVEAVFWFHPLVWWLGARLIEEREHACDEAVLKAGADPETYAQGILKVCQFYLHSPLAAVSGVSGADLKKRIGIIMENRFVVQLNAAKKALLGIAALVTVALPLTLGLIGAQAASVQTPAIQTPDETGRKRLAQRIAAKTPSPGSEAALRHQIEAMENGAADYSMMTPALASAAQQQSPITESAIKKWGAFKSLSFKGVGPGGADIYEVAFDSQDTEWRIAPLTPDGKIAGMFFRPLP